jgi:hypothetical protein
VAEWCGSVVVGINDKLAIILFTLRRKFLMPRLRLNGICLDYLDNTKYLGVIIDTKLSWASYCKARAINAVGLWPSLGEPWDTNGV